ncbi:MAG: exonuclease domain-containing protein [Desulfuromonadales bacterium]
MIPEHLIFLDLETTGINPARERITEVGLCEVHNGRLVEEWSTLVNPGKPISPHIERITGITTAMVAEAPPFTAIADQLQKKLRGKTLVAHNARFDYGFLKSEFDREGIPFHEKVLCTVKLSRALYPEQKRHSLDEIIARHDLQVGSRHRALGDAQLIHQFFEKISEEHSTETLAAAIQKQFKRPSLPPHLPREEVEALPSSPGVYLFCIDHIKTAGELGALLLEARLIKDLSPVHNKQLRRTRELCTIRLVQTQKNSSHPEIAAFSGLKGQEIDSLYGIFRTRREAENTLREIIDSGGFCHKALGLEKGKGACFHYQIKKCRGACVGFEPLALHEARFITALSKLKMRSWPFRGPIGIKETSTVDQREDMHVFNNWCYLGTAQSDEQLQDLLANPEAKPFDLDNFKTLNQFLDRQSPDVVLYILQ